jgi:integrase/recombinase XerD
MKQTKVSLSLDSRSTSKRLDDTYPIKIRVRHKNKNRLVPLGSEFGVTKIDWNKKKSEIRSSASVENAARLRVKCERKLMIAKTILDKNVHLLSSLSPSQVAELIQGAIHKPEEEILSFENLQAVEKTLSKGFTLREWTDILILRKEKSKKFGTANWYNNAVIAFLKFVGDPSLLLKEIDKSSIEDWKADYMAKDHLLGGLNTHLRAIRAIMNYAVDEEKLDPIFNPFAAYNPGKKKVKIQGSKPEKKAVNVEIINAFKKLYYEGHLTLTKKVKQKDGSEIEVNVKKKIKQEDGSKIEVDNTIVVKKGSSDWHCINEALFMWETLAMNFIDLVKLKVEDVQGDIFEYSRSKTGAEMVAHHTPLTKEITSLYSENKRPNDYLFRYGWLETKAGHKRYSQQLKRWNARMTKLAEKLGFKDIKFSTYSLRHTLATTLNNNGVLSDDIGAMYGHSDNRSISTYLDKKDTANLVEKARTALLKANVISK